MQNRKRGEQTRPFFGFGGKKSLAQNFMVQQKGNFERTEALLTTHRA